MALTCCVSLLGVCTVVTALDWMLTQWLWVLSSCPHQLAVPLNGDHPPGCHLLLMEEHAPRRSLSTLVKPLCRESLLMRHSNKQPVEARSSERANTRPAVVQPGCIWDGKKPVCRHLPPGHPV